MSNVAVTTTTPSSLTVVAAEIRTEHEAAQHHAREAVQHAIRAGELLVQVKAQLPHGEFGAWLAANVPFGDRTARAYMRLARLDDEKRQRVADLSLRQALQSLASPRDAQPDDRLTRKWTRDELLAMSIAELDSLRHANLRQAFDCFQQIIENNEVLAGDELRRAREIVDECQRMMIDIAACSPEEQAPHAYALISALHTLECHLSRAGAARGTP